MAKIIVTGAAGFIGSNLTKALLARGDEVLAVDNFNNFYDPVIKRRNALGFGSHENCQLLEADIRDRMAMEKAFQNFQPNAVMHLAAWAGVRPSLQQPEVYVDNNVNGTTTLFEVAKNFKNLRFVMASSSSVYGGCNEAPFKESADVD
ncbi:MAG: GDP-mannose 4,6-dehydratase, partial [Planctomycetes bacterium]|nr:GDP-mannose 4,6-dehydratase [Planctomycetota bacterium]